MLNRFMHDERGFIISTELILIVTILTIGLIVGLVSIQTAVVAELNDVGDATGSMNQGFETSGFIGRKSNGRVKARTFGEDFVDAKDECDDDQDVLLVCDDDDENGR